MADDEAELRAAREAYAKRFDYDLRAVFRDLRKKESQREDRDLVPANPRRISPGDSGQRSATVAASTVQRLIDDGRLDQEPEVQAEGRSAVLRRVVAEYLGCMERHRISEQYRQAYADTSALDEELEGWAEEGEGLWR